MLAALAQINKWANKKWPGEKLAQPTTTPSNTYLKEKESDSVSV